MLKRTLKLSRAAAAWLLAAVCSLVRTPRRLLIVGWIVAIQMVGGAQLAAADTDVLGNTTGDGQFWNIPLTRYILPPLNLSQAHHGAPYLEEGMWTIFHALGNLFLFLFLALVRGAIVAMQWMLGLNLYEDAGPYIETGVTTLANSLFWPLLGATAAWAIVTLVIKAVGGAPMVSDALWVIVAGVIAVGFMTAPSQTAGEIDGVRTALTTAAAEGYSAAQGNIVPNSAGLPDPGYPAGKDGAVIRLGDAMWNVYGITPWCLASFGPDLSVCRDVGHEYLQRTDRWKQIDASTHERGHEVSGTDCTVGVVGADGEPVTPQECQDAAATPTADPSSDPSPPCADELKGNCDIVRGQDPGRLGVILFLAVIGVTLAVLLLGLVLHGLLAMVEFLLLLLVSPLALVACMIPGRPRQIGVRWGETFLAAALATVIITTLIGGVMILGSVFNAMLPTWGMFKVALLNVAVFIAANKLRAHFDNMTGMRSSTSSGLVNSYMAMKAMSGLSRAAGKMTKAGAGGVALGWKGANAVSGAALGQVNNDNSAARRGGRWARAAVQNYSHIPTPYDGGSEQVPLGRNQIEGSPARAALPAGSSSGAGETPTLPSGSGAPPGHELAAATPQATGTPGGGFTVTPTRGVRPVTVVDSDGVAVGAPRHRSGDSTGQISPTPRRAITSSDGTYVITGAPTRTRRGTPVTSQPTSNRQPGQRRPLSSQQTGNAYQARVRTTPPLPMPTGGGTLSTGQSWVAKHLAGDDGGGGEA